MGIAYRLEPTLALTVTVFDGKITGDEWSAAVRELFANPAWPPGRLALTDLRTVDISGVTDAHRTEIHAINALHAHKLVRMKSAAVGGAHFETARRFGREDRSSGLRIIPFDGLEPACAWLGIDALTARAIIENLRRQLRDPTSVSA
jgi:hypothetical protein